ncbi:MAG TPA: SPFH domain-containing protein [Candidatus Hypogeohydataceae bacterium YC41]
MRGGNVTFYIFAGILGFFLLAFLIALPFCIRRVGLDQIGVRIKVWSVDRGVVPEDYYVGWHRGIPKVDEWYIYDATIQTEARTVEPPPGKKEGNPIKLRTSDDYDVTLEIIVKYKVRREEVYKLRKEIGVGDEYKKIVSMEAYDAARTSFGKMTELDLYNPFEKRRRADEAKDLLVQKLSYRHIDVADVLILNLTFDPKLDRRIKNLKVAELESLAYISKAKAADQRGITQTIDADTEAVSEKIAGDKSAKLAILESMTRQRITEILAAADKYMVEKRAIADRYKEERVAAGQLLVDRALAEGERLRRLAMVGAGGDLIVAMEAARNINLANIEISTQQIDLLDIETMVKKLGAVGQ